MIPSIPTLTWHRDHGSGYYAHVGHASSYTLQPHDDPTRRWELRLDGELLGQFALLADAKKAAKDHVGDAEEES